MPTDINPILAKWNRLKGSAFGRWLFSRAVGFYVPYTGSIRARVQSLEPGSSVITMRDRHAVRNHLRSIHAAALLNLTEYTGGLLVATSIPADARMIIRKVEVEFVKKARGLLTARGRGTVPESNESTEIPVAVEIRDQENEVVVQGSVTVLVGPIV